MIVRSPKWIESKWYTGITLYPYVFVKAKHKNNKKLLNHESIHIQQQKELLVIGFYLLYLLNWVVNLFRYGTKGKEAYMNIIFEREAYQNEKNMEYLHTRKPYQFIRYWKG